MEIGSQKILVDADVADLYGITTREVNQAVKNNLEKFPSGYLLELSVAEKNELIKNFDRFKSLKHSTATVKCFTERGLYMLATILKSPKAIETTIAIIDTFTKVKELSFKINQMQTLPENSPKRRSLVEHTSDLIADLIIPEDDLEVTGTETTYEMNFALFKIKRTIKKSK